MLMQIELSWSFKFEDLSSDNQKLMKKSFPNWFDEDNKIKPNYELVKLISEEQAEILSNLSIAFEVKQFKSNRQIKLPISEEYPKGETHIHIPNLGLLTINEVTWIEDACTEELQKLLDEGWRILAVCPPQMQRRPDYILGKMKGIK